MPILHEYLITTYEQTGQTADYISLPNDVLKIVDVLRENSEDAGYRVCTQVPVEHRDMIGKNANYPNSERYPSFVREGNNIYVYPALVDSNIKIRYRRRILDLDVGRAVYASATTATLGGANAPPDDDAYNGYNVAVYLRSATVLTLQKVYRCSDYVGLTRVITLTGTTIFLNAGQIYYYAIEPLLPREYHGFIVDAAIIELAKAKLVPGEWQSSQASLMGRMEFALRVMGYSKE